MQPDAATTAGPHDDDDDDDRRLADDGDEDADDARTGLNSPPYCSRRHSAANAAQHMNKHIRYTRLRARSYTTTLLTSTNNYTHRAHNTHMI